MTEQKERRTKIVLRQKVSVNYDEPAHTLALPKLIKEVSDDVKKAKVLKKGSKQVSIVLLKLDSGLMHNEIKKVMFDHDIAQAGIHELFLFSYSLEHVFEEGVHIVSLREEMLERGVEFIPTICCHRRSATINMTFRDYLPFKETYILGIEEKKGLWVSIGNFFQVFVKRITVRFSKRR